MKKTLLGAALSCLLVLSSCNTVAIRATYDKPIDFSGSLGREYTIVSHFSTEARIGFTLGGIIALNRLDLDRVISEEVARYAGDAVVNVEIRDEIGTVDYLITLGLTAAGLAIGYVFSSSSYSYSAVYTGSAIAALAPFVYSSRTVTIEGDIVKYK